MRTFVYSLRLVAFLIVAGGAVSSCLSPPDYPDAPSIGDARAEPMRVGTGGARRDSVRLTVSYQDGNGDLGLATGDTSGVYTFRGGNRNYFNYFLQPYVKNAQGTFQPVSTAKLGEYNGRFPRITADGAKAAPVKGTLTYTQNFFLGAPFRPGQEVRFVISIQDRGLHESNQVTTNSFVIP